MKRAWAAFLSASLWLAMFGLMLASSGLDGKYIASWMTPGAGWLGYVLNTVSDLASVIVMYWYGRLQQDKSSKKRAMSRGLLVFETVSVVYSWLLSWRQLRMRLYAVETATLATRLNGSLLASVVEVELAAFVFAGLVPLSLVGVGYAQSLLAGRMETEPKAAQHEQPESKAEPAVASLIGFHCDVCDYVANSQQGLNAHQRAHKRVNGRSKIVGVTEKAKQ